MKLYRVILLSLAVLAFGGAAYGQQVPGSAAPTSESAQGTQKPAATLINADIINMAATKLGDDLIISKIKSSPSNFDTSIDAILKLKGAGVSDTVIRAMVEAGGAKGAAAGPAAPTNSSMAKLLLKEETEIPLKFATDLSSKTAADGDPVDMILDEDVKVGDVLVVKKGAHAVATVTNVKKAGMMGKPGELNIRLEHLKAGDTRVRLRGTKGNEGQGKASTAVALTVLFGPIGLIKHGKNVEVKAGAPLKAYVDQDTWLPPAN